MKLRKVFSMGRFGLMIVCAWGLGIFASLASAQSLPLPPEVKPATKSEKDDKSGIRIRADLVSLLVSVNDARNIPALDLSSDEFEVLEDGVRQKIENFLREENTPVRLVVMLDTSSSVRNRLKFEQESTVRFFRDVLRPIDRAAFYNFNHDVYLRQDMTGDVAALEAAVRGLEAKGGTALFDAAVLGAQRLEREKGRRILVIVSDGINTISKATKEKALEELRRAEVVVYGIDASAKTPYDNLVTVTGDSSLESLCRQTGGIVFPGSTVEELAAGFGRLVTELRSQYALSYYSSNNETDGKFRKIEVRVKRSGLQARTRDGYYAPED